MNNDRGGVCLRGAKSSLGQKFQIFPIGAAGRLGNNGLFMEPLQEGKIEGSTGFGVIIPTGKGFGLE